MNERASAFTSPSCARMAVLTPVSWDEALGVVADKLKPLAGKTHDGLAAIASTRLPAEALSMFQELFAGGFKSDMVTSTEEGMTTAVTQAVALQSGAFEGKLDLLRNADMVLTVGANLARSHMVAGFLVKRALPKGTRLVNIDPEASELDELADISLKAKNGSDLALILGLQAVIVKEGLGRAPLALENVDGLIAAAVEASGVTQNDLERAARMLAQSISPVIIFGKGLTARRDEKLVEALLALARLTGAVDGERNGLISVKGEANSLAAAQLGLDAQFALNGQQAVYAAIGDDYVSKWLLERLTKAPYLVVQASYASKLTEKADVVLPVGLWSEQAGHYLNLDGRLQQAEKAVEAPENVRENSAVLAEMAMRMNMPVKQNWQTALREHACSAALD